MCSRLSPSYRRPLFSVVDDRSGVAYQEYRCVYGEDVEAALRFLYNAMPAKAIDGFPFQGTPQMIYTDSGPVAELCVSTSDALSEHRSANTSACRKRWTRSHGEVEGQGGTAIPHGEGDA